MELYKKGSMKAFEELYRRHRSKVYGYLCKRVGSRFDRDEIQQNIFLKLHGSRHNYDSSYPFMPWLFTICRSVLIDFVRSRDMKESPLVQGNEVLENLVAEDNTAPGGGAVIPAMSKLSEDQREAIRMRYGEDFSFEEIAARLNKSESNVRQMISRGLKRLRAMMNREDH